jgi:photosystem II Psb28-2 protein
MIMVTIAPSIELFAGLPEELSNVSLRRSVATGQRKVMMTFKQLKAISQFQSFTKEFKGDLRLKDDEGEIAVTPSTVQFLFGGDDGDELRGAQCGFEVSDHHWDRFMRFMERYAAANGMDYQAKSAT